MKESSIYRNDYPSAIDEFTGRIENPLEGKQPESVIDSLTINRKKLSDLKNSTFKDPSVNRRV